MPALPGKRADPGSPRLRARLAAAAERGRSDRGAARRRLLAACSPLSPRTRGYSSGDRNHLTRTRRGRDVRPHALRTKPEALEFVRAIFAAGKPVGVICHGPWTLIDAGVAEGRTLTSWPSLQTDLRNAGAVWVEEEVHIDQGLVSSRKPDDLEAFKAKIVEEFAGGVHEGQRQKASLS
ncbi:MAG TPA: DJ-1/PfpI family protein [Solirubrobacterales bacterium]|nr:DJ-1/PfpI family protein [Solirubrobacterales bacterium]